VVVSPSIPSIKTQQKKILYAISGLLTSSGIGKDVIVIAKAKVPIVKFISVQGGFKIDISLNMTNGLNVSKRVTELFKQVGEDSARALVQVVKAFLNQRNMNEVYSGGLGSYSIILLVASFLQMHPKLQAKEIRAYDNLGTLLIEFLEVYGKNFNFDDVGICVSGSGSYYSKVRRGWARPNQPYLLSIEDPADPSEPVLQSVQSFKS
jgi:non-canonical poly(A) RNA polymerase PAPD5/7